MKRIAVMTSGGDAPGMNAAVRAVVRAGMDRQVEVYGIRQAYQGLLAGDMALLTSREVSGILQRGGTVLQTARNEEFKTRGGQRKGKRRLNEHGIEGVIVNRRRWQPARRARVAQHGHTCHRHPRQHRQ